MPLLCRVAENMFWLNRYVERGIVLRRTDAEGALHVRLPAESGGAITVQGQGSACRYWTERPCP